MQSYSSTDLDQLQKVSYDQSFILTLLAQVQNQHGF